LQEHCKELAKKGIKNVVVSGVFSAVKPDQEIQAGNIIKKANASIRPFAKRTITAFKEAIQRSPCANSKLYLTQNDGTLMSSDTAELYPVHTFASGLTNSMRGAAYLSGIDNAIVVVFYELYSGLYF
jgi:N-methylhydantoinase A/oxoprolinase/acetone carboxylase beta subunit